MRVTFDARNVGLPGIGRYITGLWGGLTGLGADVVGIWPGRDGRGWLGSHHARPAGEHVVMRARPFLPAEQAAVPWVLRRVGADVHHATHFNLPYVTSVPIVLTVHDLIVYLDPSKARSRSAGAYYRTAYPRAVRRADVIVAISPFTASAAHGDVRHRGHPAARHRSRPRPRPLAAARRRRDRVGPTPLRASRRVPAVRRHCEAPQEPRDAVRRGTARHIRRWSSRVRRRAEIGALGIDRDGGGRRIVLGRVPDAVLPALYSGARVLVLPSLHEGFGLTPLEAMACATPVVVSDGGALPDTVGAAAVVLPARDVGAWADMLTTVCVDDGLRARLVAAGRARAGAPRWRDAAERYLDVYRSVAA